jgi:uncharacterized membrane protein
MCGVWGFLFGFASRCVALLCVVYVQLHLVLFPAGGPFLRSLYVIYAYVQSNASFSLFLSSLAVTVYIEHMVTHASKIPFDTKCT